MTRPSRHQDLLMLETAKRLLPHTGMSRLSVKRIARESGVNAGMFHYHFKSKADFCRRLLESVQKEILTELRSTSATSLPPVQQLRKVLINLGTASRDHRTLFVSLLQDLLNGEKVAQDFAKDFVSRGSNAILPLLTMCIDRGDLIAIDPLQAMQFCIGAIHGPNLSARALKFLPKIGSPTGAEKRVLSDEAVEQRVDLVLRALSTRPRRWNRGQP